MLSKKDPFHQLRKRREIAQEIQEQILSLKENETLIVVEGKKDRETLQSLGAENIFSLDRIPLFKAVEMIEKRSHDVALLVDLDSEGKKIYSTLRHDLSQRGVRIDDTLREFLYLKTSYRQIEALSCLFDKL